MRKCTENTVPEELGQSCNGVLVRVVCHVFSLLISNFKTTKHLSIHLLAFRNETKQFDKQIQTNNSLVTTNATVIYITIDEDFSLLRRENIRRAKKKTDGDSECERDQKLKQFIYNSGLNRDRCTRISRNQPFQFLRDSADFNLLASFHDLGPVL